MRILTRLVAWVCILCSIAFLFTLMSVPGVVRLQPVAGDTASYAARGQLLFQFTAVFLPLFAILTSAMALIYTGAYLRHERQIATLSARKSMDARLSSAPPIRRGDAGSGADRPVTISSATVAEPSGDVGGGDGD